MKICKTTWFRILWLGLLLLVGQRPSLTHAAVTYWDPQGTTGGNPYTGNMSGTWENASWSTASGGLATPVNWNEGTAACFGVNTGNGTPAFTVTMNANHTISGVFDGPLAPNSCNVTINGTGQWILSGVQGFDTFNNADGSLGLVTIAVPIIDGTSTGEVVMEGNGQFYLNAANTYSGNTFDGVTAGTQLGYSANPWTGVVNFNSSSSFGSGSIALRRGYSAAFGALVAEGTSAITLPNVLDFSHALSNAPFLNIVGNPAGVTFTAGAHLGTKAVNLGSGGSGNLVNISGVIDGSGSLTKFNNSVLELSAVNTYGGPTTISAGTLKLGIANAIASSSSVVLNGGTLDAGGFNHANTGTLGLSASSTLNFSGVANLLQFANSSAVAWTSGKVLNLADWTGNGHSGTEMEFGTDATGLTTAQLAEIEIDGNAATLGTLSLDSGGFLVIPEPSTALLGLLGTIGMIIGRATQKLTCPAIGTHPHSVKCAHIQVQLPRNPSAT
ncbi:MAG: hypothetical protein C5B50_23400 [Verrucomicrobia bacterium]|nr:MAG: hypothetical protein C5B50_23400 [Verrucomicrobiota bacterium]